MEKYNSLEDLAKLKDKFPKTEKTQNIEDSNVQDDFEKEVIESNPIEEKPRKDIYLTGGSDAEMRVIKKRLKQVGQEYLDKNLKWGAKIEDYSEEISKILEEGNIPVAIELAGAEKVEGTIDIDHHNEKSNRPASLLQVMERLNLKPSLFDELIAANDSGFIPAMEKKIEEYRYQIENGPKGSKELFEELKKKWISVIRKIDRKEQGITQDQEKQAEEAIKTKEDFFKNTLSIVRLPHSKCATVTDRLYGTYENLFIPSGDGESNFYGNGKLCQELKEKYEGSWAGGSGLGDKYGNAYWGGYPDQDEVEKVIKEKVESLSQDLSRFDKIFIPENYSNFTEIGKKIYELGSFERMNDAVEVSNVEVTEKGNNFIVEFKPKEGWEIYSVDSYDLAGGYRALRDREREAKNTFGFSGERELTPSYIFLQTGENIPDQIRRGLQKVEGVSFRNGSYMNGKYYEVIKNFPKVEEAIKSKLESVDPRLLKYLLGKVDISTQETWETSPGDGYFGDPRNRVLNNTCKDFEMLGLGGYTNEHELAKLKNGEVEIFTPDIGDSADSIKKRYEELEKELEQFKSPINREIQEKKIQYFKRVYEYVKKQEDELNSLKNNPELLEKYFACGNMESPLEFNGTFEDLERLNTFLKDKIVATYQTYGGSNYYSEHLSELGKYVGLEYLYQGENLSLYDFNQAIKSIDGGVSFSQDTYAVNRITEILKKAGYEVEGVGKSGFKSRNSFVVLLPKVKVETHVVKYGKAINGKNVDDEKVWYCGKVPIDVNDQNEREKVLKIIEEARREEKKEEIKEFVKEFKSKGDGIFAVMDTGGREKYQSIPDRFKVLASMRIANTQDHRQNRSHTYANAIIDIEAIKDKKSITIKVPDNMKGLVIGKGGQNIKRISEELGLFIKVV